MNSESRRILELDGLRGIAIGTVLLYHYFVLEGASEYLTGHFPGAWRLQRLLDVGQFGWMGVDIFFALSGFLIGGILLDSKSSTNYFGVFYARRAYRILPVYLLLCVLAGALWQLGLTRGTETHRWLYEERLPWYAYLTFSQNVWMAHADAMSSRVIDATWSLAIEEQFYLILPLLLWLVNGAAVPWLLMAGIALAPIFRVLTFAGMGGRAVYLLTYCRMDALLVGALIAWAWRQPVWRQRIQSHRQTIAAISLTLGSAIVLMAMAKWNFGTRPLMTWGLTVIAMWCGTLVVMAIAHPECWFGRGLRVKWLGTLGGIAYAVYLFHQPVLGLLHLAVRRATPALTGGWAFAVTLLSLVTVITCAQMSWRFLEGPLVRRGHARRYAWTDMASGVEPIASESVSAVPIRETVHFEHSSPIGRF